MKKLLASVLEWVGKILVKLGTVQVKTPGPLFWFLAGLVVALSAWKLYGTQAVQAALPGVLEQTGLAEACTRYVEECHSDADAHPTPAPLRTLLAAKGITPNDPDAPVPESAMRMTRGEATSTVGGHPMSWLPHRVGDVRQNGRLRCESATEPCSAVYRARDRKSPTVETIAQALCTLNSVSGTVGAGCGTAKDGTWTETTSDWTITLAQVSDSPLLFKITVTPAER